MDKIKGVGELKFNLILNTILVWDGFQAQNRSVLELLVVKKWLVYFAILAKLGGLARMVSHLTY